MEPNPVVVELLELYLKTAREQKFDHVAIAMTGYPNVAACDYAGDVALELAARDALTIVRGKLQKSIDNWNLPERDTALDASYACYNVVNGPLGFDFIVWLVDQEMTRVREKAPSPLRVGFWLGRTGDMDGHRTGWLENVFRPALKFIGAVEDKTAVRGRNKQLFVPRDIIEAFKQGEKVPRLCAPCTRYAIPGAAVTITLRETFHDPYRNSNMGAWVKFARDLMAAGEQVVIVRDTAKAHEPLEGLTTDPLAAFNLTARMALYQDAKCNLFVQNGPCALAHFSDRPYLQFSDIPNDKIFSADWFVRTMGFACGEQYPWATPQQRIIWAADSYDNITAAWHELNLD